MYGFVDNIARQHRQRALCYALNLSKKKKKEENTNLPPTSSIGRARNIESIASLTPS